MSDRIREYEPRWKKRFAMAFAGSALALGATVPGAIATADNAAAAFYHCDGGSRNHDVTTVRHAHVLKGAGKATNLANNTEQWCDFFTQEQGEFLFDVCDYQGAIWVYNPDGSYTGTNSVSSYHSGCSLGGWFYYDNLEGSYAENKRFNTKWKSEITNYNWTSIGTLVD